jgi:hemerythrin-like domain-containing protein
MIKERSIAVLMVKHHYKIDKLLHIFNNTVTSGTEDAMKAFYKFRWELEKHFFLEEKAIFQLHYSDNKETNKIKEQLKYEHTFLLEELDQIENKLKNNKKFNLADFRKLLIEHKNIEDHNFYPRLEKELDEASKDRIILRISNPI